MRNELFPYEYGQVVVNKEVIDRLPRPGPVKVSFHWFIIRWMLEAVIRKNWQTLRYYSWVRRVRCANFESIALGPIEVLRPMPWLLGPAKQLHPEAFI